jgi:hypothetical protein
MTTSGKRWTESERREFIRKKTNEVTQFKYSKLTEREKYMKEQQRKDKKEVKKAMEEGQWITIQHKQQIVEPEPEPEPEPVPETIIKISRFNWSEDD